MSKGKRRKTPREHDNSRINFDPASQTFDADYAAFHKRAKTMPQSKRRAIEEKFQAAFAKQREEHRRWVNTYFRFWHVCADKACRRTSRCAGGEPEACFDRWWPLVPERHKVYFRACITHMKEGMTAEELGRAARAEVERQAEHIARIEAEQALAWEARQTARSSSPLPLAGEGGETPSGRSRPSSTGYGVEPGEGCLNTFEAPSPRRSASHPLPASGEREERSGPRVRAL